MQESSSSSSSQSEKNISSTSASLESTSFEENEVIMKNNLTNALIYCKSLLEAENLLTDTPPAEISAASIAMGEKIYEEIKFILEDHKIIIDEDLIRVENNDIDNINEYKEV